MVERFFNRIKQCRRIATRYNKLTANYLAFVNWLQFGYGYRLMSSHSSRFGLHPAAESDGSPAAIGAESALDRLHLLRGVDTFNLHPHLPQFERLQGAVTKLDVLVRQKIDLTAPPHPFTRNGRTKFDALLQSRPGIFAGNLFVDDVILWFSTAGGVDSLRQLWTNVVERPNRS